MTLTAVVILNWNGQHFLETFLENILENSTYPNTKVVVADNGSTDHSVEYVRHNYPQVELVLLDKNYGYAGGYVKALEQIEAKYYVLLNSDVEVSPNWLTPLIDKMESNTKMGACMPKIMAYNSKENFEYAGASGGYIDRFGFPFCRGRILDNIEGDAGQYNTEKEIFWASGAAMVVRAEAYYKAGGLDPDFFAHMEEIDLCWRIKQLDYKIFVCPNSTVYHVGGGTLPNNSPRKLYLNYRNSLYLLLKNLPGISLIPVLLARICLDTASEIVFLSKGERKFAHAVFKAHLHFLKVLPSLINKRYSFKRIAITRHVNTIYNNSIVLDYMVFKRSKFSELRGRFSK